MLHQHITAANDISARFGEFGKKWDGRGSFAFSDAEFKEFIEASEMFCRERCAHHIAFSEEHQYGDESRYKGYFNYIGRERGDLLANCERIFMDMIRKIDPELTQTDHPETFQWLCRKIGAVGPLESYVPQNSAILRICQGGLVLSNNIVHQKLLAAIPTV